MSTGTSLLPRRSVVLTMLAAGLMSVVFLGAIAKLGGQVLVLAGAAAVAVILVQRPAWALLALVLPVVLIEDSISGGLFPGLAVLYEDAPLASVGIPISPLDGLLFLTAAATLLDGVRRRDLRLPDPLTLPLLLVAAAAACGVVVGVANGASLKEVTLACRPLLALIVVPIAVVNCLRTREAVDRALLIGAALIGFKSALGVVSVIIGQGYENPGDPGLTYLSPTSNWLALCLLLVAGASMWHRRKAELWLVAISCLSLASLLMSYRRSFWIAAVAAIVVVVVVGGGRRRWRVLVPGMALVAVAVWLPLTSGAAGDLQGPIAERAATLNPSEIEINAEDSYRIGERRNVLAEIERHPLTGLGLGIPWTGQYPPSVDRPGSRDYVHFTALWWWLKLGLIGLVAYALLTATAVLASYRLWKADTDPLLQAFGLGMVGALVGLALAETTAAFTGATMRFSLTIAVVLGILVSALKVARGSPDAGEPAGWP